MAVFSALMFSEKNVKIYLLLGVLSYDPMVSNFQEISLKWIKTIFECWNLKEIKKYIGQTSTLKSARKLVLSKSWNKVRNSEINFLQTSGYPDKSSIVNQLFETMP